MTRALGCDFPVFTRHLRIFLIDSLADDVARDAMELARTDRRAS
jgi:hypothetical protein